MSALLRMFALIGVLSAFLAPNVPAVALSLLDPFNIPATLDGGVVQAGKSIAYAPGERHTLDIYVPEKLEKSAPVIVFLYGGAWRQGTKDDYPFAGHAFAAKGFVTVIPDYRLVPEAQYPVFLGDNAAAIKWVEDNIKTFGGDPKRVFLVGHSAGAYNAVMLGMDSIYLRDAKVSIPLRGVVGISGPYAVYPFEFKELQEAFGNVDNPEMTQPINLPTNETVPLLLLHGDEDFIVSPENTKRLAQKLTADGIGVEMKLYEELKHMEPVAALSQALRWKTPVLDDIVTFLTAKGAFSPDSFGPVDLVATENEGPPNAPDEPASEDAAVVAADAQPLEKPARASTGSVEGIKPPALIQ